MRVIEAPKSWYGEGNSYVFLAGGIVGCPDWQSVVIDGLSLLPDSVMVLNPRRKNFPMGDEYAGRQQINWEFDALSHCDMMTMWFCAETIQPICMYELGRYVTRSQMGLRPEKICLGVDPAYERRFDVYNQMDLLDHSINISETLEDHIDTILLTMTG